MSTLELSVHKLYETFSVYPLREKIEGCPCCISNEDKECIHSQPLKKLSAEDLSRYVFKAMTTWGNTDDFKYFLPRIFEILTYEGFYFSTATILGKLEYANFDRWPESERLAIQNFLSEWWKDLIKTKPYFDHDTFICIYKITGNLDQMLKHWETDVKKNGFVVLVDCIYYDTHLDLKELGTVDIDKINSWIRKKSEILEEGFFYFEKINKNFATTISNALFILENSVRFKQN
ncbi:hypothetical protein LF887_05180 [Chryseobacterium sp. MEBOG06]|uniref:hypothetical protein n=1 Tax=Chryseobacterium sp. MEBOG06 TaxID=2879938 RepID=UPI001F26ABDE|nr:hypothetical protein [Chryseobacterium sp. MEBOG06]UKB85023.1 hypothetical protein LF887_05180 [Chryseobacterium sp. MEBOG06]